MGANAKLKSIPASLWSIPTLISVDLWSNAFENQSAFGNINYDNISPYLSVVHLQPTKICQNTYFNQLSNDTQQFLNKYHACFQPCDYMSIGLTFICVSVCVSVCVYVCIQFAKYLRSVYK